MAVTYWYLAPLSQVLGSKLLLWKEVLITRSRFAIARVVLGALL